jgi:octaprenyl-diphosphate synthase
MEIGKHITEPVAEGLEQVRQRLSAHAAGGGAAVERIASFFFGPPGKLLRPTVHLLSAASADQVRARHVALATACELVHASSLIHDDVVDGAVVRRHEANLRARWSNRISVLFGDLVFTHAFAEVLHVGDPEIQEMLVRTVRAMVESEIAQASDAWRTDRSEESYLACIRGKTAALFRFSAEAAILASGIDGTTRAAFGEFGENLGMAYQILDDITDVEATPAEAGKDTLLDLRRGIFTLPAILYFRDAGEPGIRSFVDMARNGCDRADVLDRLGRVLPRAAAAGTTYLETARAALDEARPSPALESLRLLADAVGEDLRRAAAP